MILGEIGNGSGPGTTLDDILLRNATRHPEALALVDAPNRAAFTDGPPQSFTYAQVECIVSRIAARLRGCGLPADSIVAMQFANTSESIFALLGIMRAGMIAAPMPMLWRRADCIAALSRSGVKALMTCARIGDVGHAALALQVAVEIFSVRHVCAFGADLPEGVMPFDDLLADADRTAVAAAQRSVRDNPALHVAVITFDTTSEGIVPVARSHAELLASGLPVLAESRLAAESAMLSSLPVNSFAGIALTLVPWLLSGGALRLHQPFDPSALSAQLREQPCDLAVLPGPLVARLAEADILSQPHGPKNILACWRTPERLALSAPWLLQDVALIDVAIFGEIGLCAMRRDGRKPAPIPSGNIRAPRDAPEGVVVADIERTAAGTIGFGGPMAPRHPFPPHAANSFANYFKPDDAGIIDTGYLCRVDKDTRGLVVTGSPLGLVSVGSYRFSMREMQDAVTQSDKEATVVALPDAFTGHRLAGSARDRAAMRQTLAETGLNPLIVRAFRERIAQPSTVPWHDGFRTAR